jgi:glutathione S-transferase
MAASPYMAFIQFNHPERFLTDSANHDALIENARERLDAQFTVLNDTIIGEPFFLRSGLTALDLYLTMLVNLYPERKELLATKPRLERLFDAVCDRASAGAILPTDLG